MDQEVAETASARPQEGVEVADLVHQLALVFRFLEGGSRARRAGHTISAHQDDVADLASLDTVMQFLACHAVTAHQTDANLHVLFDRLLRQLEHLATARAIHRHRFFHENVQTLFDRVGEVHPTERRRRCQDDDIAWLEQVHRFLVTVEADEATIFGNVQLFIGIFGQLCQAAIELVRKHVGHRD